MFNFNILDVIYVELVKDNITIENFQLYYILTSFFFGRKFVMLFNLLSYLVMLTKCI